MDGLAEEGHLPYPDESRDGHQEHKDTRCNVLKVHSAVHTVRSM